MSSSHPQSKSSEPSRQGLDEANPPGYGPDDDFPKPSGFDMDGDGGPPSDEGPSSTDADEQEH